MFQGQQGVSVPGEDSVSAGLWAGHSECADSGFHPNCMGSRWGIFIHGEAGSDACFRCITLAGLSRSTFKMAALEVGRPVRKLVQSRIDIMGFRTKW